MGKPVIQPSLGLHRHQEGNLNSAETGPLFALQKSQLCQVLAITATRVRSFGHNLSEEQPLYLVF